MAPCKLLAALEEAGLNNNELDLIQYELDMDADADDDEENEEHEEAEQLGSGDSEDDNGKADTSSTVHNTLTPSHPSTRMWKHSTKSNEQDDDDDDGACMHSQFQDCPHKYHIRSTFRAFKDHCIHSIYYKLLGSQENCVKMHPCQQTA
jgi:hypothetical protein